MYLCYLEGVTVIIIEFILDVSYLTEEEMHDNGTLQAVTSVLRHLGKDQKYFGLLD